MESKDATDQKQALAIVEPSSKKQKALPRSGHVRFLCDGEVMLSHPFIRALVPPPRERAEYLVRHGLWTLPPESALQSQDDGSIDPKRESPSKSKPPSGDPPPTSTPEKPQPPPPRRRSRSVQFPSAAAAPGRLPMTFRWQVILEGLEERLQCSLACDHPHNRLVCKAPECKNLSLSATEMVQHVLKLHPAEAQTDRLPWTFQCYYCKKKLLVASETQTHSCQTFTCSYCMFLHDQMSTPPGSPLVSPGRHGISCRLLPCLLSLLESRNSSFQDSMSLDHWIFRPQRFESQFMTWSNNETMTQKTRLIRWTEGKWSQPEQRSTLVRWALERPEELSAGLLCVGLFYGAFTGTTNRPPKDKKQLDDQERQQIQDMERGILQLQTRDPRAYLDLFQGTLRSDHVMHQAWSSRTPPSPPGSPTSPSPSQSRSLKPARTRDVLLDSSSSSLFSLSSSSSESPSLSSSSSSSCSRTSQSSSSLISSSTTPLSSSSLISSSTTSLSSSCSSSLISSSTASLSSSLSSTPVVWIRNKNMPTKEKHVEVLLGLKRTQIQTSQYPDFVQLAMYFLDQTHRPTLESVDRFDKSVLQETQKQVHLLNMTVRIDSVWSPPDQEFLDFIEHYDQLMQQLLVCQRESKSSTEVQTRVVEHCTYALVYKKGQWKRETLSDERARCLAMLFFGLGMKLIREHYMMQFLRVEPDP